MALYSGQPFLDRYKFESERIHQAFQYYADTVLESIKKAMNVKDDSNIDRHKIIAGYIKAFLTHQIFEFDDTDTSMDIPDRLRLINEYFCLQILKTIINADWGRVKGDYNIKIHLPDSIRCFFDENENDPKTYEEHFYKLLHLYRDKSDDFPIFTVAHLIFYMEMTSGCLFSGMIKNYFTETSRAYHPPHDS